MNDQDRGQWTSASAAQYDSLCPGRHLAQRGIPEPEQSEDAASGTRIHAALAGEGPQLSPDEQEIAYACSRQYGEIVKDWQSTDELEVQAEHRLWIEFGDLKHSGKPDIVTVQGFAALIVDFKTGRGEVAENPRNLQLRDLAVLVARNYGVFDVTVAIVQPWATAQPPCKYTATDLAQALELMESRVKASNDPKSPRIPGPEQCQYCRARATCPEFAASALPVSLDSQPAPTPEGITKAICSLSGERLGLFLSLVRLADEVATDQVRQRLSEGEKVDGWKVSPGRVTEKIVNPQTLFERFVLAGGKTEQFLQSITVAKGKFKDALREVAGLKGKALDGKLSEMLQGITESKEGSPVLERE